MRLLDDIKAQPDHIRELLAGLCTIVVVSAVGAIWFHSFKQNVYALLNPDQQTQTREQNLATGTQSLFGSIGQTVKDATAQIGGIIHGSNQVQVQTRPVGATQAVHVLPVSGSK